MRVNVQRRDRRKMLLHGVGGRQGEFNRPGIRKEKKFVVVVGWVERRREAPERNPSAEVAAIVE